MMTDTSDGEMKLKKVEIYALTVYSYTHSQIQITWTTNESGEKMWMERKLTMRKEKVHNEKISK